SVVVSARRDKRASLQWLHPVLAPGWAGREDGPRLTFQLRQGVKWHDGQPFTAKDVVCTFDLRLDKGPEKLRVNPGISAFKNLDHVSANGDFEVTFHLKRPQVGFLTLLAPGGEVIYPCHASPQTL